MKKLFTVGLLMALACCYTAFAAPSPANTEFQAPTMNIEGTASSIVSKLDKSLILTEAQKPKLLNIVTNYLRQKVNIQPLQQSNLKAYTTKMNSMQNGLHAKLKPLLTLTQYTEFLGLKPKSFDDTNVLSQLYY
ncbi:MULTISPECIES: hypothetical protein [Chitinophaga]|uniref:hypothetical protein n=1 Tax=Chitinophaga TaxID=79328 RepID=UPI000DB910F9|nr:hypothetical protein [Chitinophaga ginsengisegetis]MDR6565351.1 hypothetical protein [Chitinophaga ginsengisegetis]MDR6645079.1 hypothetical protein [Chitinophaga ginsengisegetis]MDR6652329.1 hypothetical protein [Chitinophaga ginsengisegetis]